MVHVNYIHLYKSFYLSSIVLLPQQKIWSIYQPLEFVGYFSGKNKPWSNKGKEEGIGIVESSTTPELKHHMEK